MLDGGDDESQGKEVVVSVGALQSGLWLLIHALYLFVLV